MNTAAVILAAGMGKRMRSELPKVMHPVLAVPMIERAARAAEAAGVTEVIVVIGHGRNTVIPLLEKNGWNWAIQEEQLGTAHAVSCATDQIGNADEVVILMGDVPLLREETIEELLHARRKNNALLAVLTTTPPDVTGYGRVIMDHQGRIDRIVEEKDASVEERECRVINTGIMAFDGSVLAGVLSRIGNANAQNEFYLTDAVAIVAEMGRKAIPVFTPAWQEVAGVNNPVQLVRCTSEMKRRVVESHLLSGVVIPDADSVWIEESVIIGKGTVIGRNCRLSGDAVIGTGVVIGDGSIVDGVVVESGEIVEEYSILGAAE
ncbi:MAG: NTP transferase domain-containing protein [Candidatus Sabulitectum sp.]|nr:NTP transferase domain-containing protein [Candidatus Sabulitectum sp.]